MIRLAEGWDKEREEAVLVALHEPSRTINRHRGRHDASIARAQQHKHSF